MKKLYLVLFTFFCFFLMENVSANTINSIDMSINIDESGNAHITEVWNVLGTDGTEWYKSMDNLGNTKLTNFKVSMDNTPLTYKSWNVNESLEQKKGYYGINYTNNGLELCFGKSDYSSHIFTLNYDLSNYVINTGDTQTLYWTLIGSLSNVNFKKFSAVISSYYEFPDTLDVWGYGYKGYAYVKEGKIHVANDENTPMGSSYVVLLAKFPGGTFKTDNFKVGYETFDDVLSDAEKGSYQYDYSQSKTEKHYIGGLLYILLKQLPILLTVVLASILVRGMGISSMKPSRHYRYEYKTNKKIKENEISVFRDIPCNKDILYANTLLWLNNTQYKSSNIFSALILKWIKEGNMQLENEKKGIFNGQTTKLILEKNPAIEKEYERQLYYMVYAASEDGILETKEMKRWCREHYTRFLGMFDAIIKAETDNLTEQNHIFYEGDVKKNSFRAKYFMDDKIYEDSIQLFGLKKFLKEFSRIKEKEPIEVHMWDEYLMFACMFGLAEQVTKKLKEFYPEIIQELQQYNYDKDVLDFINDISTISFNTAYRTKHVNETMNNFYSSSDHFSSASDYSSGGGGFSSGGGGGGSFGGGHSSGGGSR